MFVPKRALLRFAFQQDGQPRFWLRHLLLKNQLTGEPRAALARVIFKKNGCVRLIFADWFEKYLRDASSAKFAPYLSFIRGQVSSGHLARAETIHIVTSPHTEIIGDVILDALADTRLVASRSLDMPQPFDHDLYIIVAPQMFDRMPPPEKTIIMQVEQVRASSWVTPGYLDVLSKSLGVLDYSQDNIDALVLKGLPGRQLFYVPLIPYMDKVTQSETRDIDILFYGALQSARREKYLQALSEKYNIRVEINLFGEELRQVLRRTKVVVNIHFYEDALLETTRLMEAVRCGAKVLSETAVDQVAYQGLMPSVTFVDCGDVPAFSQALESILQQDEHHTSPVTGNEFAETKYHILRALNGLGILDFHEVFEQIKNYKLPSDRLVLSLPEQGDRYKFAHDNLIPRAALFHGLRNIDGWKGCAMSYKLLAAIAMREARSSLLIYEDDADIPSDIVQRLDIIEAFLSGTETVWDVYSGLISDLDEEFQITDVTDFGDEVFVQTTAFVGLVFCIYNEQILRQIAEFEFVGEDILKHTIDRQLEATQPRCVTTMKPLVGHAEAFSSSIWNNKNSHSTAMITQSAARLERAVQKYRDAKGL
jgi:hypothetical protein